MNYLEAFSNLQVNLKRVEQMLDGMPNDAKTANRVEAILEAMTTEFRHHVLSCKAFDDLRLHMEIAEEEATRPIKEHDSDTDIETTNSIGDPE